MENIAENAHIYIAVATIIGAFIGYIFGKSSAPGSQENKELQQRLADSKAAQDRLQSRVEEHFSESAQKLDALTQQYRDVYTHIASGAAELCQTSNSPSFGALVAPADKDGGTTIDSDEIVMEPPRDYAPKSSPDDPGVLNESFGIDEEELASESEKPS
ncbi:MAG: DUF1043 family protein [Pseudomonadota bacterium]